MTTGEKLKKISEMRKGEKTTCWYCEKGVWHPQNAPPEKAHLFICDKCGEKIIFN